MLKNKNILYIVISLAIFVVLALVYNNPVISGKQLLQHDIVQYKGGAKELLDYRANTGKETYWSDAMYRDWETDRKSTRLNSSHRSLSRMPSSA